MRDNIQRLSQSLSGRLPSLKSDLNYAGIDQDVIEYIASSLMAAVFFSVLAMLGSYIALAASKKLVSTIIIFIGALTFCFILFIYLYRPRQLCKSRAYRIEQGLVFGLEAIRIEMFSGVSFTQSLQHLAEKDYGEFSRELRWVLKETTKHGLKSALEMSAERNPSKIYRRSVWQIVNSLETGADINANLTFIVGDLKNQQETEAMRYGKSIERYMTFYIMGAIVFPALAIIVVQTLSSLGIAPNLGQSSTYYGVLAASVGMQVVFINIIRFRRPALLTDVVMSSAKFTGVSEHLRSLVEYSGAEKPWKVYILDQIILCLVGGGIITLILYRYVQVYVVTLYLATLVFLIITAYTRLVYLADLRGDKATEYLPDALRMMAANMEAGVSIDHAVLMSAKKEFDVLGREIKLMGTDLMKNMTFEEALMRLRSRIKSEPLQMSVNLISHGIRSGSGLSDALFGVAKILQDREHVKQDIITQLHSIRTTIVMLITLSAPLLFACAIVSSQVMSQFNEKYSKTLPAEIQRYGWVNAGRHGVSVEFLNQFIMLDIFITVLMGSIIIGAATSGKVKDGLRYALMLILTSEIIYIALRAFLWSNISGAFK